MIPIGIELALRCGTCGNPLPISGFCTSVTCIKCRRPVDLDAGLWQLLLADAASGVTAPSGTELASSLATHVGLCRRVLRRSEARCSRCQTVLALDPAALARGALFCAGCGARAPVRAAPPPLAALGACHVVGERAPGDPAAKPAPIVVHCPACGAPLELADQARKVSCAFCKVESALPDDLLQRLAPREAAHRWYAVFPGEVAASVAAEASWAKLSAAVTDADGNLYLAGALVADATEASIWSVNRSGRLRWSKRNLAGTRAADVRLCVAPGGELGVWAPGAPSVLFLAVTDGDTRRSVSAPDRQLIALGADNDGSLVALIAGKPWGGMPDHVIVARFSPEGRAIETWPGGGVVVAPEIGATIPKLRDLPNKALWVQDATDLVWGWNGQLRLGGVVMLSAVLSRGGLVKNEKRVEASLARNGAVASTAMLPRVDGSAVGSDAEGRLIVRDAEGLALFDKFGKSIARISTTQEGGWIGAESRVAVAPDGTVWLAGDGGRLRRIGPGGALEHVSAASRADEAAASR